MMDWIRDFFFWTEDDTWSDCLIDIVHAVVLLVLISVSVFGLAAVVVF